MIFDSQGTVARYILQKGKHTNSKYYRCKILPQVINQMINKMKKTRSAHLRTGRVYLLLDNASSHKTKEVREYLAENKVKALSHPPSRPDLSPCDFWLFPLLMEHVAGMKLTRCQDLAKEVHSHLPRSEYEKCFKKWMQRLRQCIEVRGEYFQGLSRHYLMYV